MKFLNKNVLSFAGLVFIYFLFWAPVINVLPSVTTGNMGRDFYAFQMTFQNKWPCRDYWWQYGPLMLLYYGFWLLVNGVNLVGVRMGLGVIYFLSAVCTYRTLRLPPFKSSITTSFFSSSFHFRYGIFSPFHARWFLYYPRSNCIRGLAGSVLGKKIGTVTPSKSYKEFDSLGDIFSVISRPQPTLTKRRKCLP